MTTEERQGLRSGLALAGMILAFMVCVVLMAIVLIGPPLHAQPNVGGSWYFTEANPNGKVCNQNQSYVYMPSGALYTCQNGIEKIAGGGGGGGGGIAAGVCPISFAGGVMTFPSAATGNTGGTPCNIYTLTLSTTVTGSSPATNPAGMTTGQTYGVILTEPGGGGVALNANSGPSNFLNFPTTTVPLAANAVTVYGCFWTGTKCAPVPTATTAAYGTAASVAFASLPSTCPANVPQEAWINDATVSTIGSAITTGGGTNLVYGVCFVASGNWIVVGSAASAGGAAGIPYCPATSGGAGAAYTCTSVLTSPVTGNQVLFSADASNPGSSLSTLNTGNGAKAIAGTASAGCLDLATIEPIILVYNSGGGGSWRPGFGMPCLPTTVAALNSPFVGGSLAMSLPNSAIGTQTIQEAGANVQYLPNSVGTPGPPTLATHGTAGATTMHYQCIVYTAPGTSPAGAIATIGTANASLSPTDYVSITCPSATTNPAGISVNCTAWNADSGGEVLDSMSNVIHVPCDGTTPINDQGFGYDSPFFGTPPSVDTSAGIGFEGLSTGANGFGFPLNTGPFGSPLGWGAVATGYGSAAIGGLSTASGYGALAAGAGSKATGVTSVAFGALANASGDGATALGTGTVAAGTNSAVVGQGNVAAHQSLLFGSGIFDTADQQVIIGAPSTYNLAPNTPVGFTDLYWNSPADPTPVAMTIHASGGQGTNIAGADHAIAGGQGTGSGAGGAIRLQVAPAGSTGTSQNALVDALVITGVTGSAGQAMCWKTSTTLSYCTSVVGVGGACTCH